MYGKKVKGVIRSTGVDRRRRQGEENTGRGFATRAKHPGEVIAALSEA
jgi:hypothetical protein